MPLIQELKRRNVFRVGLAYVVAGWLLLQVGDVLVGLMGLPDWSLRLVLLLLTLGFPVALIFSWVYELTPEGVKREKDILRDTSITRVTGRKLDFTTIAMVVAGVAFVLVDRFVLDSVIGGPDTTNVPQETAAQPQPLENSQAVAAQATDERISIAVLPFVNMSSDQENEYFSDGISEELLNVLARLPQLKVAARTSSFQFKGRNLDVGEIGRQLGVRHVLEGSVRKAGDQVRITAQLIQVSDGFHLWSDAWDRELANIFALQTEIAEKIAGALKVNLLASDEALLTAGYTNSLQAYDNYLLGRHHYAQRNEADLKRALRFFQEAIAIDPDFALAYVGVADVYAFLQDSPATYGSMSYAEVMAAAQPAIHRALQLQPDLAEAHASLGLLLSNGPDPASSAPHFERALALNPNYSMAHMWYGLELMARQRFTAAAQAFNAAAELDPLTPVVLANRLVPLMVTGRRAEAEAALHDLIELAPESPTGYAYLAFLQYLWGDLAAAQQTSSLATDIQPMGMSGSTRGLIFLALDDFASAEPWMRGDNRAVLLAAQGRWDELYVHEERRLETTSFPAEVMLNIGQAEMQRGNFQQALRYLELPGIDQSQAQDKLFSAFGAYNFSSLPALDLAHLYQLLNREEQASALLAQCGQFLAGLEEAGIDTPALNYVQASYYALSGDVQMSFEKLALAIERGWTVPWLMRIDMNLDPLRSDAKFGHLLGQITERAQVQAGG